MYNIDCYNEDVWHAGSHTAKLERVALKAAEGLSKQWKNVEVRKVDETGNGYVIAEWTNGSRTL